MKLLLWSVLIATGVYFAITLSAGQQLPLWQAACLILVGSIIFYRYFSGEKKEQENLVRRMKEKQKIIEKHLKVA